VVLLPYADAKVEITPWGTFGYKGMSKKYENQWPEIPMKKFMHLKKNRVSAKMTNSIPVSNSKPMSSVSANDLNAFDWSPYKRNLGYLARFTVGAADWLSMSTFTTRESISGYPFTSAFATSDGPPDNSTGIPYMYITPNDLSWKDLQKNSKATVAITLVREKICTDQDLQPDDLGCGRVILSGNIVKIPPKSQEEAFAAKAIFSRHPVLKFWKKGLGFFFVKLNITKIVMLNYIGGVFDIPLDDYFNNS
jgi:hypothetical protein